MQEILPTACNLYKWKTIQFKKCIYCTADTQDARHLLYECPSVQTVCFVLSDIVFADIKWKTSLFGSREIKRIDTTISLISYVYKKYLIDKEKGIPDLGIEIFLLRGK